MGFSTVRLLAVGATILAACGPATTPVNNGTGGKGGSGGSGGTGAGGSGGSGGSGAGGATGGTGGGQNVGGSGGAGGTMAGSAVTLPMSVTAQFPNQGWFADKAVSASFAPGSMVIKQADATTGPCAMRPAEARGKCLKIVYTPPAGLVPPSDGSFVGVFFLTTLNSDHPELMPPAKIGEANWGAEPGRNIAPGATQISFSGAADADGTAVAFKAGTDLDSFAVKEQPEVLGTTWKTYSLSLAGQTYGTNVVGAFAWIIKDTTKPATFYLDNIVWQ
jgi:hypothetical protein